MRSELTVVLALTIFCRTIAFCRVGIVESCLDWGLSSVGIACAANSLTASAHVIRSIS